MAKCHGCKQDIGYGPAQQKMVSVYVYADQHTEASIPFEGIKAAIGGRIKEIWHYKCYKVWQKKQVDTDVHVPNAYEIQNVAISGAEAQARGLTFEEAKAQGTAGISAEANAASAESIAKRRQLEIAADREADPGFSTVEKDMAWPAGGQLDAEI